MGWRDYGPPEIDPLRVRESADLVYKIMCWIEEGLEVPDAWIAEVERLTLKSFSDEVLKYLKGVPNEDAAAAIVYRMLRGESPPLEVSEDQLLDVISALRDGRIHGDEEMRWWTDALAKTTGDPWFADLIHAPLRELSSEELLDIARARGRGEQLETRPFGLWVAQANPAGPGQDFALPPNTMFRYRKLTRARDFPADGEPDEVLAFARDARWTEDDLAALEDAAQLWRMAY